MAEIAVPTGVSICSTDPDPSNFPRYVAGEAIFQGAVVALHADAQAYKAVPTDRALGFAPAAADIGEPVTAAQGRQRFYYGSGLTPATDLFVSGTVAGGLATVATGGAAAVAHVIDVDRIQSLI